MGGVFAADAVRQLLAHRIKIPPQVPLTEGWGRVGGARWDTWRTGCPAFELGAAAREALRHTLSPGDSAADVPPREPQANDWRGGRAGAITS